MYDWMELLGEDEPGPEAWEHVLECLYETEDVQLRQQVLGEFRDLTVPQAGVRLPLAVGELFRPDVWQIVKDGHPAALALFRRHYSARQDRNPAKLFVGPGEKLVLILPGGDALFAWRLSRWRQDGQTGIECTVFRNESPFLSSALIRQAVDIALSRWPTAHRLFTYVDPAKVRSRNPGYCFECAGWRKVGRSQGGLLLFEVLPLNWLGWCDVLWSA